MKWQARLIENIWKNHLTKDLDIQRYPRYPNTQRKVKCQ